MSTQQTTHYPIEVKVKAQYRDQEATSDGLFYVFTYRIQITNLSNETVQLLRRHWIITDGWGRVQEVRGAGVVGLQPRIAPGQTFEYESFCPLLTNHGSMKGSYEMISAKGDIFQVNIPEFWLLSPEAIH